MKTLNIKHVQSNHFDILSPAAIRTRINILISPFYLHKLKRVQGGQLLICRVYPVSMTQPSVIYRLVLGSNRNNR